jgi:cellulose synthase/poly-beta-1,6-N-acetylglucosamine synthase-like glycosyltransferase
LKPLILGVVAANALLLSVFVGYHLLFLLLYPLLRWKRDPGKGSGPEGTEPPKWNRFLVVIPAHNEELMLREILESARGMDYPRDKVDVVVIADNCTDRTAEIARAEGVRCEERTDARLRGKPYALDWLFRRIDIPSYDAYVIVDADTRIGEGFLRAMNGKLNEGADVVQGYFDILNPTDSWLTRLSIFTGIIKFRLRYFCKERLGLSCPLMGNGMCFRREVIARYGWNSFSLTENWEYFANLVLDGYVPTYAEKAVVYSHAVVRLQHGETQRARWVRGRLQTSRECVPKLLRDTVKRRSVVLLDAAIELLLPSHSMLLNWNLLSILLALVLHIAVVPMPGAVAFLGALLGAQFLLFACVMPMSGAPLKTWLSLPLIPVFLAWRFFVTVKAVLGLRKQGWEKTERHLKD